MGVLPERKVNPYKRLCGLCNKAKRVIFVPKEDSDAGFKVYVCDTCD